MPIKNFRNEENAGVFTSFKMPTRSFVLSDETVNTPLERLGVGQNKSAQRTKHHGPSGLDRTKVPKGPSITGPLDHISHTTTHREPDKRFNLFTLAFFV